MTDLQSVGAPESSGLNTAASRKTVGQIAEWLSRTAGPDTALGQTVLVSLLIPMITLGSGILLARSLGVSGRGNLAIAMLWPTLIAGIGGMGIAEAVTFYSSREKERLHALAAALAMGVVQSLVLVVGGYLLLPLLLSGQSAGLLSDARLYLWIVPLYPLTLYPLAVLQGRLEMRTFNISRLSVHVANTLILIGLAMAHSVSIHTALLSSLAATAAAGIVVNCFVIARRSLSLTFDRRLLTQLLSFGAKMHLGNLAALAAARIDIVALSLLASSAQLGYYVVATSVGMVALFLPTSISLVLYPIFSRQPADALPLMLSRFLLIGVLVTLIAGPILVLAGTFLTAPVFGHPFQLAVPTVAVLVVAYAIKGWNVMLTAIVRGGKRPFRASLGELIGLVLLTVVLPVLVPTLGSLGAAFAVTIGALAMLAWMVWQALTMARVSPRSVIQQWSADLRAVANAL